MTALGFDQLTAISEHSSALAAAAEGHLDLPVPSCPGWTIADLVAHLTDVQWFWATIAEDQLPAPPTEERRPARAPDLRLVEALRAETEHLLRVLGGAEPAAHVWTWAAAQQDVAFITRHQVQEAAVHHWDAANAIGRPVAIGTPVAVDSISEFLTFSVSSDADPIDPPRPALEGRFALRCTDADAAWTIFDGRSAGTVRFEHGVRDAPALEAGASDLLLWLYRRVELPAGDVSSELLERFSALRFTD
ncbi:MAG: maleylpyruvate isomerase family mycothiol-dependent enzyme [Candidatus Dormibacteraceae bacterium]